MKRVKIFIMKKNGTTISKEVKVMKKNALDFLRRILLNELLSDYEPNVKEERKAVSHEFVNSSKLKITTAYNTLCNLSP